MIIKIANDDEIKAVLCRPDIYDSISSDKSPRPEDYKPAESVLFVSGFVDSDLIGIMAYHDWKDGLKCHIHVLPEYRKHARQFARMALKFGEAKNAIIYTEIPDCFKSVVNFAKKFGFKEIGSVKEAFLKRGKLFNATILRLSNGNNIRHI